VGARPLWASAEDGMKGDEIEPCAASSDILRHALWSVATARTQIFGVTPTLLLLAPPLSVEVGKLMLL
jgi:hypothetical protein